MRGTTYVKFLTVLILPALLIAAGCGGGGNSCPPTYCDTSPTNDPGDVFRQCGPVDIVIVMDTSGSMDDEAEALCTQVEQVIAELTGFGLVDLRLFKWGITEDADDHTDDFTCLTDNVRDVFGDPIVPGYADRILDDSESDEEWASAVAILSHFGSAGRSSAFQWRSGAIRIIVPISDMDPDPRDDDDTAEDVIARDNAITYATANDVIVAPIVANEAEVFASEYAREIANATDGVAARSTDPSVDLGELIYNIVFVSCGGRLDPPAQPGSAGPTMLIAAGREDGMIYSLNPSTGAISRVLTTNVSGGGTGDVLQYVSSMIYNERTNRLWAGVGGNGEYYATTFTVSSSGVATELSDNYDFTGSWVYAHPGMAMNRATRALFGTAGDDDILLSIDNISGEAFIHSWGTDDTDESGNALTFVGNTLYLASGEELWRVDTYSGRPTRVADLTLNGFSVMTQKGFNVISMTTRPSDNTVFGIVKGWDDVGNQETFLATINMVSGVVTYVGPTGSRVDGITWVPSGYFAGS